MHKEREKLIKRKIQSALAESLNSKKLFILTLKGYSIDKKIPREDRFTFAISSNICKYLELNNLVQYCILDKDRKTKYIDIVQFIDNSQSFSELEIDWALEAKHYSPHLNKVDDYINNSLGGIKEDIQKLINCNIKNRFLLLIQTQILSINLNNENITKIIEIFPFIKYLGNNIDEINTNIEQTNSSIKTENLVEKVKKCYDKDLIFELRVHKLTYNTAEIEVGIFYILFKHN